TIGAMAPGEEAKLTLWRKGGEMSLKVTLGELPKERSASAAPEGKPAGSESPKLGLMLAPAGNGGEGGAGTAGDPDGPASDYVKAGDIILDVGGKKVASPADVRDAITDAHKNGKRTVLMRLKSDTTTKFVAIPIARA